MNQSDSSGRLKSFLRAPITAGALTSVAFYTLQLLFGVPSSEANEPIIALSGVLLGYGGVASPGIIAVFVARGLRLGGRASRIFVSGSGFCAGFILAYMFYSSFSCDEWACLSPPLPLLFVFLSIASGLLVSIVLYFCFLSIVTERNHPILWSLPFVVGALVII
ncbi:hypothetical protein [Nocardiopsis rhodophaea]|uniref:hypothetical protein n=1 Tax=Nocardiopsis rhodophaea TaxID=280238 RepID=UPI0031E264EA